MMALFEGICSTRGLKVDLSEEEFKRFVKHSKLLDFTMMSGFENENLESVLEEAWDPESCVPWWIVMKAYEVVRDTKK
jgi:hypothetical protein